MIYLKVYTPDFELWGGVRGLVDTGIYSKRYGWMDRVVTARVLTS